MIDVTLAEGPPQYRGVLTVFPLVSKRELKLPHRLLVDALAAESLNVPVVRGIIHDSLCSNHCANCCNAST